jgi:hypothetical protein
MADAPDITHGGRYPSMAGWAAEVERAGDPAFANRYWSMPGGAIPDRRVPRHPAEPAPAARPTDPEAAKLRARYPSMAEAEIRPTEAEPKPAAEGETAAPDAAAVEIPAEYQGIAPENFTLDERTFAAAAAKMREANFSRAQAAVALQLHAEEIQRSDAALLHEQQRWQAELQTLTNADRVAIKTVMSGAPREVVDLLNNSGLGDHPGLCRWIATLGKRLGGVAPADDQIARRYPNTKWD